MIWVRNNTHKHTHTHTHTHTRGQTNKVKKAKNIKVKKQRKATSFPVQDVMPVTSARLGDIARAGIGTRIFFSICIMDCAPNKLQLMLKEAMHIKWEKQKARNNKQLKHADLTLSF